jgi:(2Fe-2S) ferredoxin
MNVLASYRDGLHWWKKVDRPRVVHVSMFKLEEDSSPADRVLRSTAAYTVAIHWRQAARYLQRAEAAIQGFASKLKTPQSVD